MYHLNEIPCKTLRNKTKIHRAWRWGKLMFISNLEYHSSFRSEANWRASRSFSHIVQYILWESFLDFFFSWVKCTVVPLSSATNASVFLCRIWMWVSILKVSWTARFMKWMAFKPEMKWKVFCKMIFLHRLRSWRSRDTEQLYTVPTGHLRLQSAHQKHSEERHPYDAWLEIWAHAIPLHPFPLGPLTTEKMKGIGLMCIKTCCQALETQMPLSLNHFLSSQDSWHQFLRDSPSLLPQY